MNSEIFNCIYPEALFGLEIWLLHGLIHNYTLYFNGEMDVKRFIFDYIPFDRLLNINLMLQQHLFNSSWNRTSNEKSIIPKRVQITVLNDFIQSIISPLPSDISKNKMMLLLFVDSSIYLIERLCNGNRNIKILKAKKNRLPIQLVCDNLTKIKKYFIS